MRLPLLAAASAAALLAAPAAAVAAPATPDPAFGASGVVLTGVGAQATGMLLDGAGRPVVVARTAATEVALLRRAPDGRADSGPARVDLGADAILTELVQHGDGYVAGGRIGDRFGIVRFTAAGTPDPAFGIVRDAVGEIGGLAVDAQQRIVAAGRSGAGLAVARFAAGGARETLASHDVPGVEGEDAGGVVVEPDGRTVVAGTGVVAGERRFLALALTPAGARDPGFGAGGAVTLDVGDGGVPAVRAISRQPDGKLLLAGTTDAGGGGGGLVARLLPDGRPDVTFSGDGIARLGVAGATAEAVALQPDGKVVVAGAAGADALVARFRPGGARDPGFGTDGVARTPLPAPSRLAGIGVAPGGGIVAGGLAGGAVALVRLTGGDSSDPALAMTADGIGDLVTFTVSATNRGADPARDVRVAVTPPPGLAAWALTGPGGACAGGACSLGTVPAGATARVTLLARARQPGPLPASAAVTTATFDADPANNAAGVTGAATRNRAVRRDRTEPALRLRLGATRLATARRRLRLRVTTSEVASVRLTARAKGVERLVRPRRVLLARKGVHRVTLTLTRAGRRAVARARRRDRPRLRRLAIVVGAHATDRAGNHGRTTQRLTLRP